MEQTRTIKNCHPLRIRVNPTWFSQVRYLWYHTISIPLFCSGYRCRGYRFLRDYWIFLLIGAEKSIFFSCAHNKLIFLRRLVIISSQQVISIAYNQCAEVLPFKFQDLRLLCTICSVVIPEKRKDREVSSME